MEEPFYTKSELTPMVYWIYEKELTNFYQELLKEQVPLEQEFEQIITDNLWELYIED